MYSDISKIAFKFVQIVPQYHPRENKNIFSTTRCSNFSVSLCTEGHLPKFSAIQTYLACSFDVQSLSSAYAKAVLGRRSSISRRNCLNRSRGTATSTSWNVTYRPWFTFLARIFTCLSRSVVSCQWSTFLGSANVRLGSKADVLR